MIDRILSHPGIDGKLNDLLRYTAKHGIPLYVLIDEYDNFANTILAHRGAKAYESFYPRRRLLPQLLRHPQGGRRARRRRGAHVHYRRVADHHG